MFGFSAKEREAAGRVEAIYDQLNKFASPLAIALAKEGKKRGLNVGRNPSDNTLDPIDERELAIVVASAACLTKILGGDNEVCRRALQKYYGDIEHLGGKEAIHQILYDSSLLTRHKKLVDLTYEVWGNILLGGSSLMNNLAMIIAEEYYDGK